MTLHLKRYFRATAVLFLPEGLESASVEICVLRATTSYADFLLIILPLVKRIKCIRNSDPGS